MDEKERELEKAEAMGDQVFLTASEADVLARAGNGERAEGEYPPTHVALCQVCQSMILAMTMMEWMRGVEGHCGACT